MSDHWREEGSSVLRTKRSRKTQPKSTNYRATDYRATDCRATSHNLRRFLSLRYRSSQSDISTQNAEDTNHYYVIVQFTSGHEQQDTAQFVRNKWCWGCFPTYYYHKALKIVFLFADLALKFFITNLTSIEKVRLVLSWSVWRCRWWNAWTSVEINFLHKLENATNASRLLWDWPIVKDIDFLFAQFLAEHQIGKLS